MASSSSTMSGLYARSRMVQSRQEQPSILQEPMRAAFYIRSSEHPKGQIFNVNRPVEISMLPPVPIKRPALPEMRERTLQMLAPCTFFVQYPCQQKCRTMGLCIHYQFVVGCRKCPDGLRCSLCIQSNVEQVGVSTKSTDALAAGKY